MPLTFDAGSTATIPKIGIGVAEDGDQAAACDGDGDVALRVLHLLGGAALQLEADVVEQQQRYQPDEDGARGPEVTRRVAVNAVLDRVDDDGERKEAEHQNARRSRRG